MSVGHLSRLSKVNEITGNRESSVFFSGGFISHLIRKPETRWAVIGGFCEDGFSGSPVFLNDGSLLGVLVETIQTGSETDHPIPQMYMFPVISALAPFRDQILAACK
jgi:hypothetical protein